MLALRCAAIVGLASGLSWAQAPAPAPKPAAEQQPREPGAPEEPEEIVAKDSPRASMTHFLELARSGDFEGAAAYLDVPQDQEKRAPALARRLVPVLDRNSWIDVEKLSPLSEGNLDDGLPAAFEKIGTVPSSIGVPEQVRLVRKGGQEPKWVFSRGTVEKIDSWYSRLEDRWFLEHMPMRLLRVGPKDLLWWQWLALPIILGVASAFGLLLNWVLRGALLWIGKRARRHWDGTMFERVAGPLWLAWTLTLAELAVPMLVLYAPAEEFLHALLRGGYFFDFFWALSRFVDVLARRVLRSSWGREHLASRGLVSLMVRVSKVMVVVMAIVAFLSELGYPVASLVAGLGIGGLAVALAAQKTVENLFGAFSISADQPFREGDLVRVDGVVGNIEAIGLRSTKIRTADRTIVSLPNGKLADTRIESFAPRDRILFTTTLRLAPKTTAEQMQRFLHEVEDLLKRTPKVRKESVLARFSAIGEASLDVDLACTLETNDYGEFQLIRQRLLLEILELVEQVGTAFARPVPAVVIDGRLREQKPEPSPAPESPGGRPR